MAQIEIYLFVLKSQLGCSKGAGAPLPRWPQAHGWQGGSVLAVDWELDWGAWWSLSSLQQMPLHVTRLDLSQQGSFSQVLPESRLLLECRSQSHGQSLDKHKTGTSAFLLCSLGHRAGPDWRGEGYRWAWIPAMSFIRGH